MSDTALTDKVAIVTGAGMGMGEATAILFARNGAKVMVSDVNEAAGRDTVDQIERLGGVASFVAADVSDEAAVEELIARTVALYGRLDCAVNNAGITPDVAPIADADLDVFDRIIAVNLRSVLICLKHEIRQLIRQGSGGAIVNIGSVSSVRPQPRNSAYVAAKHGVIGLTKTASLEYAPQGIRVNAVLPGAIDTPMIRTALEDHDVSAADMANALSLFGRFGRPGEIAEASLWLCSDAASFVTGHSLAVDGGYLAR